MTETVLVTGATGQVARVVATTLLDQGVHVRALSRDAHRARQVLGDRAEVVAGDWTRDQQLLDRAVSGVDRVFLAMGTVPDQDVVENLVVDAAAAAGRPHVVKLATIGSDLPVERLGDYQVARWHAAVERNLHRAGLPTTVLRPNAFMTNLFALAEGVQDGVVYSSAGDGRVSMVDPRDVAAVAAALLTRPVEPGDYLLTGPEALSYTELADGFTRVLDRPVTYVPIDDDAFRQALRGVGLPDWLAEIYVQGNVLARRDEFGPVAPDQVQELTGRPRRSVEDWLRENRPAFSSAA